jgi:hypothetical protein
VVTSRYESRPFALSTHSGFGQRQIAFDSNVAVARGLFDWLVNHGRARLTRRELCEASAAIPTRPVRDVVDPDTGRHRRE